jgi:cell division protein FtsB
MDGSEVHLFEFILGGIQLTLLLLAGRIAYMFGSLAQKVDNLNALMDGEKRLNERLSREQDSMRERVARLEQDVFALQKGD